MAKYDIHLQERSTGRATPAILDDLMSLDSLFNAEEQWAGARIEVFREIAKANVPEEAWPQSLH